MAKLISKTYGEALFELSLEEQKMDIFFEEVKGILEILSENTDFSKLMNHPKISKEEKISVAEAVFKGKVSDELTGFLVLIINKDRFSDFEATLTYFIARVKEEKKIGVVTVTTAIALEDSAKAKVEARILETTQYCTIETQYLVDAALIGGMVIRIGDRVVDSSIATKLYELKKQLMNIQLG
ncbi:MAG: ATP synthase F1 subunit delta [Lachnospiraceae bacterium]